MRAPIILGLAAVLASGLAHAQESTPLDRAAVLRLAHERSPQVLAARARLDEAAGALSGARAWAHNPELELEFTNRELAEGRYRDRGWRVDQRLDLMGRGARIGAARADLAVADGQRLDADLAAAAEAARAWLLAVHAGAQRALADEGASVQERLRAVAAARYVAGETGALDEALATVALARARAAQALSRSAEWDARAELAALLQWDGAELPQVAGELEWPAPPPLADVREAALAHPALAALAAVRTAAEARRRQAGALAWPEAGVFAGAGREEEADLTQFGVSLSLPIFARGQGERRQAAASTRLAQVELEAARGARLARVGAAWQRHRHLQLALTADDRAVAQALEASVRLAEAAYRLGEIPLDEALLAQREQLEARRDLNDLRLTAALAALDVAYLAALPPLHEGDRP